MWLPSWHIYIAHISLIGLCFWHTLVHIYTSAEISSIKIFFCGTSAHIDYGFAGPRRHALRFYAVYVILLSHTYIANFVCPRRSYALPPAAGPLPRRSCAPLPARPPARPSHTYIANFVCPRRSCALPPAAGPLPRRSCAPLPARPPARPSHTYIANFVCSRRSCALPPAAGPLPRAPPLLRTAAPPPARPPVRPSARPPAHVTAVPKPFLSCVWGNLSVYHGGMLHALI